MIGGESPDQQQEMAKALKDLDEVLHIRDLVYYVREHIDYTGYEGNSWEHPTMTKFSNAYSVFEEA